jgi:hypothetical protein
MVDHFPTFSKIKRTSARQIRRFHWRNLLTERGLVRGALYALLFLTVLSRLMLLVNPTAPWAGNYTGYPVNINTYSTGVVETFPALFVNWIMNATRFFIGPMPMDGLLIVLCLVGLAASLRPPHPPEEPAKPGEAKPEGS